MGAWPAPSPASARLATRLLDLNYLGLFVVILMLVSILMGMVGVLLVLSSSLVVMTALSIIMG
jgi:hypothetical protein